MVMGLMLLLDILILSCSRHKKVTPTAILYVTFSPDLYKLTDEVLGQGAYAKVQGCISLQNGQEFAVKVSNDLLKT